MIRRTELSSAFGEVARAQSASSLYAEHYRNSDSAGKRGTRMTRRTEASSAFETDVERYCSGMATASLRDFASQFLLVRQYFECVFDFK